MTRSARTPAARIALIACFALGLASAGCGGSPGGSGEAVAYDPVKSKSQEDSMRKAAREAAKSPR